MKSEVVYIDALFIDEKYVNITKYGEVLLFDGSSADGEVVVIPYNDSDMIVLKKGDIKTCHYDAKTNLVNFVLSKPCMKGVSYQIVTFELNSQSRSLSKELKSEFYLFLNFCLNHFNDVELKPRKHINEFCNLEMRYHLYFVRMSGGGIPAPIRSNGSYKFKHFLRAYVYFLNHYQLSEEDFKKFMRSQENIPSFCKDILGFQQSRTFYSLAKDFIMDHMCRNDICCKGTFKKCSICRITPYCSMECQTQNWPEHKPICQREETNIELLKKPHQIILDQLKKQLCDDAIPVSFEVFQQELVNAVSSACWPLFEEPMFAKKITDLFSEKNESYLIDVLKSLRKKQYSKMIRKLNKEKILSQIDIAWD